MSQNEVLQEALEYIKNSRFATLNYTRTDKAPVSRAMGSYAFDGTTIIFSTAKSAPKVEAIRTNKKISFFFEQDNQELAHWKNVLVIGDANVVEDINEKNRLVGILAQRSPRFKERIEKGELDQVALIVLNTEEIQYMNRGKPDGVNEKIFISN